MICACPIIGFIRAIIPCFRKMYTRNLPCQPIRDFVDNITRSRHDPIEKLIPILNRLTKTESPMNIQCKYHLNLQINTEPRKIFVM